MWESVWLDLGNKCISSKIEILFKKRWRLWDQCLVKFMQDVNYHCVGAFFFGLLGKRLLLSSHLVVTFLEWTPLTIYWDKCSTHSYSDNNNIKGIKWHPSRNLLGSYFIFGKSLRVVVIFFFLKEFQLMMSTPDNSSLSSNQDINRFFV